MSAPNPPYFINPAIDALPEATGEERVRLIRFIAANVGDEAALRTIIGVDPAEFAEFYPDMKLPELSTGQTIDTFITRFSSERAAAAPDIEAIVAAAPVDYASMIAAEEGDPLSEENAPDSEEQSDATSDAITAFLAAVPPKVATPRRPASACNESAPKSEPVPEPAPLPGPELSEALFRLMVKNKNYRKALEIINELSLNNPKKSIYFAYQIRFLEKLIKNQEKGEK
ncbi:MAG: hypothetical protein K2N88_02185 [Muribaculaceae bacterium]|nr:hypothetical protein [Muribaculaceae bacterium]